MTVISVNDAEYQSKVLDSQKPVLLDFWAEWCGPCKMIAPTLEKVAEELGDKAVIAKMNVDENPETPSKIGVRGIPMLALFKGGKMVSSKVGVQSQKDLTDWVLSFV